MAESQVTPGASAPREKGRFEAALIKLNIVLAALANLALWLLTGLILVQVIARHLGYPLVGSDEVSVYLMLTLSFIGIGHTWSEDGHFRLTLLTNALSANAQRALRLIVLTISLLFAIAFTYGAYKLAAFSFMMGFSTPSIPKVPVGMIQGLVFLGGVFLTLSIVQDIVGEILRRGRSEHDITHLLQ